MRIRVDSEMANARRLRDMYVEDVALLAVTQMGRAMRRVVGYVEALVTGHEAAARARGTSCRS